jgi:flagellar biosynthetic protein FliR
MDQGLGFFTFLAENIDVFVLIFVRITAFLIILPVFSASNYPMMTRIGFSVIFTILIFSTGVFQPIEQIDSFFMFGILMVQEFAIGFMLGFVVYVFFAIIYFAGQLIDFQMGFAMVNVIDPLSQIQVPIVGNFIHLIMTVYLMVTGGINQIINVFLYSFQVLSPGNVVIWGNSNLYWNVLEMIIQFYITGVLVALPILSAVL